MLGKELGLFCRGLKEPCFVIEANKYPGKKRCLDMRLSDLEKRSGGEPVIIFSFGSLSIKGLIQIAEVIDIWQFWTCLLGVTAGLGVPTHHD